MHSPDRVDILNCRQVRVRYLHDGREPAECQGMMTFTELAPEGSDPPPEPFTDRLRLAVAAYLACFKGSSRGRRAVCPLPATGATPGP